MDEVTMLKRAKTGMKHWAWNRSLSWG